MQAGCIENAGRCEAFHESCHQKKDSAMKQRITAALLAMLFLAIGTAYGLAIGVFQVFPHDTLRSIHDRVMDVDAKGPWSIGIFEGPDLLSLEPAAGVVNPVLTADDVTDRDAVFVADPFWIEHNGEYHMFFEVLNGDNGLGEIALARSPDARSWTYEGIVLDEDFHLSYPHVFEWQGEYYMIPESGRDFSVRLYRARDYPTDWEHLGNLLSGYRYVDPSIFRFDDTWWMFVGTGENDVLNLYYSDELYSGWRPHPSNPVIKSNMHIARPGGRVTVVDGTPIRFTQDGYPSYGLRIFGFRITELTRTSYAESPLSEAPLLDGSGTGWNAAGMHHLDPIPTDSGWIAVVDGRDR
jgi:hypothetical protein